jgi:hypothetical protein
LKRACLALIILAWAALPLGARVYFVVSPPRFEMNMVPGQNRTETINIINGDSSSPLRLKVSVKAWEKSRNGQTSYYGPSEIARSCGGWVVVNPSEFEVPANGTETARFTITVPESASGSYWAMIFFESQPDTSDKSMVGVRMVGRLGASVYANIDGTLQYQSQMTGFSYRRAGYQNHEFTVSLKNLGNAYFRPKGTLEIRDGAGTKIASLSVPDDVIVLPGGERDIKLLIKQVIPPGRYTAVVSLDCGQPELLEGELAFDVVS